MFVFHKNEILCMMIALNTALAWVGCLRRTERYFGKKLAGWFYYEKDSIGVQNVLDRG